MGNGGRNDGGGELVKWSDWDGPQLGRLDALRDYAA